MRNALTIFLLSTLLPFFSTGQEQDVPPLTVEKISENLYQLVGGKGANSGMYIGENEVLLIDAKMDKPSVEAILTAVEGFTNKPVRYLINTHSDGDHVNGNEFMPDDIVILAHENCRNEFFHPGRDGTPSKWNDDKLQKFLPQITFTDRMKLHLGEKVVELHYFGIGHTTGDIVVYFPEEQTAFIGDQVFFERPQLIHSYKGGNSFEHVKTTELMLETIDAVNFCTGHAEMKQREDVEKHIEQMKKKQQKVKTMASEGKSLDAIQAEFLQNERQLIETIFNEINKKSSSL
ncbi:MAG TPA: MBL fold metallo-hydrolase [Mariniphaga sp.]|nr:MBL fold metallo-hydrolase [Mariniphaga sp.]